MPVGEAAVKGAILAVLVTVFVIVATGCSPPPPEGWAYVKLGQLLSTRPDVLPAPVLAELARSQGEVAPAPRDTVEAHLSARDERPVEEVFAEFDWTPLGATSIGQVDRARLDDGRAVVDFTRERERMQRVAAAFADEPHLHVPDVHSELSSDTVLVMELVDGPDVGRLRRAGEVPANGADLASALLRAELSAMVRGEEFHADPHPGNAILMADGRLALIDFGSTGHLDAFERGAVTDILTALQLRDPTVLREALTQVATIPDDVAPEVLERALARLLADRLAPGMEPTPGGPSVSTDLSLYQLFGLIGLVAGAILLMRVVLEILQSEP